MRYAVGAMLGLLSGFLIYMLGAMIIVPADPGAGPSGLFVLIFFIGGWIASTYFMVRQTRTVTKVVNRGSLIGAAEWLLLIPAGLIMSSKAVASVNATSDAEMAGVAVGGGLMTMLAGGVGAFMAAVCLATFAITHFMGREMKPEAGLIRKCPDCAEEIQAAARKCRYCGAAVEPVAAAS